MPPKDHPQAPSPAENPLAVDTERLARLQLQSWLTFAFLAPLFGVITGVIFWVIAWLGDVPVTFLQCWAAGWLVEGVTGCIDQRQQTPVINVDNRLIKPSMTDIAMALARPA